MRILLLVACILLFFLLLLLAPVRLRVVYRNGRLRARAYYLFVRLRLDEEGRGGKKKPKKRRKRKKEDKAPAGEEPREAGKKRKLSLAGLRPLLRSSKKALRKLCKGLVFYRLRVHILVAREDAHQTAVAYGRITGAAALALEILEELFTVRRRKANICIEPDFVRQRSEYRVDLGLRIRPAAVLAAALRLLPAIIKLARREPDAQRKGGNQHESTASHR